MALTRPILQAGLLGVAAVSTLSLALYQWQGQQLSLREQRRLAALAAERQQRLDQWLDRQRRQIRRDLAQPALRQASAELLRSPRRSRFAPPSPVAQALNQLFAGSRLSRRTTAVLSSGGIVLYSTRPEQLGRYQPLQNTTTFLRPEQLATAPFNLYTDSLSGLPTISLALPLGAPPNGTLPQVPKSRRQQAVLAVELDLGQLHRLVDARLEGSVPVNIRLVGETALRTTTVIHPDADPRVRALQVDAGAAARPPLDLTPLDSPGIRRVFDGESGADTYLNDDGVPVLAHNRWIPQLRMALLVEARQAHVLAPARRQARQLFILGNVAVLLACLAAVLRSPAGSAASRPSSRGSAGVG